MVLLLELKAVKELEEFDLTVVSFVLDLVLDKVGAKLREDLELTEVN